MNETITKMDSFKFFQIGIQCTIICTYMIHTLHVSNLKDLYAGLAIFQSWLCLTPMTWSYFCCLLSLNIWWKDYLHTHSFLIPQTSAHYWYRYTYLDFLFCVFGDEKIIFKKLLLFPRIVRRKQDLYWYQ